MGFLGGASGKKPTCQCRIGGFTPWIKKIIWGRKWQPTPVSLPGESYGQRSLAGYVYRVAKSWSRLKDLARTHVCTRAHTHIYTESCKRLPWWC